MKPLSRRAVGYGKDCALWLNRVARPPLLRCFLAHGAPQAAHISALYYVARIVSPAASSKRPVFPAMIQRHHRHTYLVRQKIAL